MHTICTRICSYFCMKIEKPLLLWTLITMVPLVFENFDFKGYLSHSIFWKCLMRFFGSGTSPWTQISYEGTIFDAGHDDPKTFQIFENFGKSRNQFWDSTLCLEGYFENFTNVWNLEKFETVYECKNLDFQSFESLNKIW